jgi:hypothetical protein
MEVKKTAFLPIGAQSLVSRSLHRDDGAAVTLERTSGMIAETASASSDASGAMRLQASLSSAFGMHAIELLRSNKRPLRFNGVELVEANSHAAGGTLWIELSLFRKENGGYVLAFRLLSKRAGEIDIREASSFMTREALINCLESYDAASVLPAAKVTGMVPEQVIAAIDLRQRMAEARMHFSALADELIALMNRDSRLAA